MRLLPVSAGASTFGWTEGDKLIAVPVLLENVIINKTHQSSAGKYRRQNRFA